MCVKILKLKQAGFMKTDMSEKYVCYSMFSVMK